MFTPQQLEQISFDKAVFGGYDMESVDEFLEPLLEDYGTLYKENATLKSKMRVLVEKLEEYRQNESNAKEAVRAAQQTCDNMIREAEAKCRAIVHGAKPMAPAADTQLSTAKAVTRQGIESMEEKLKDILSKLEALKAETADSEAPATDPASESENEDEVAKEIAESLEKLVGTTVDSAPVAPRPPVSDAVTSRFTNLQFGKNYDPNKR